MILVTEEDLAFMADSAVPIGFTMVSKGRLYPSVIHWLVVAYFCPQYLLNPDMLLLLGVSTSMECMMWQFCQRGEHVLMVFQALVTSSCWKSINLNFSWCY